jgi:YD repeat-containing protein
VLLVDASNQIYSDTRFHYDGRIDQAPTRGDVTLVQKLTGRADQLTQTVDMTTDYDIYGNVTASRAYREYGTVNVLPSSAFWESSTNYDSIQNDPAQSYPRSVTNALGQSTSMAYLYTLGVPYQTTDPNSWTTSTTYDGLGRTRSVTPPGLSQPGTWYTYPLPDPATGRISAPHSVEMQILDTIAGRYRSMWGIYDGAGRMIQTQADAGSSVLVNSTLFNAQGLARQQSLPYSVSGVGGNHIANSGNQFTATEYDPLGRVIRVIAPGNLETLTSYDGLTTTVTDPKGNKVSRTADGLGRMTAVAEFSDASTVYATTIYSYDAVDRLIRVRDAQSNGTTIQYDWLGRKKGMDDPDMGIWAYIYDPLGNMSSQTDARNHQLSFSYDALNRLLTKNDDDPGTLPTSY